MPIYEFVCPDCEHEKDKLVSIGTDTLLCSSCGGTMHKVMSAPYFHLKGGVWAKDNYGLKKSKKKEKK